jgi:hypothetical protein
MPTGIAEAIAFCCTTAATPALRVLIDAAR